MRAFKLLIVLLLPLFGACRQIVIDDHGGSGGGGTGGGGTGGGGTSTDCPTISGYTPAGGTIGVNQNRSIGVNSTTNWPSNCDVVWSSSAPSRLMVNGGDNVREIDGVWYYTGRSASIRGISVGTATICAHVIRIGSDGKWRRQTGGEACNGWTVSASSSDVSFDTAGQVSMRYQDLGWVSQMIYDPHE